MTRIDEIVHSFQNRAVSKSEMVKILAQQQGGDCTERDIAILLRLKGERVTLPKKKRCSKPIQWTPDNLQRLRELWGRGVAATEIGRSFGISRHSVWAAVKYYQIIRGGGADDSGKVFGFSGSTNVEPQQP